MPLPGAKAGRRSVSVRLGEPGDASEEDIEEEPERPAAGREARWARIAQSAVKQCLRRAARNSCPTFRPSVWEPVMKHLLRMQAKLLYSKCGPCFRRKSAVKQPLSFCAWRKSGDGMSSGGCICACRQINLY